MQQFWYIWSIEHNAWWGDNGHGYFDCIDDAGIFTQEEAMRIITDANINLDLLNCPNEARVPMPIEIEEAP